MKKLFFELTNIEKANFVSFVKDFTERRYPDSDIKNALIVAGFDYKNKKSFSKQELEKIEKKLLDWNI